MVVGGLMLGWLVVVRRDACAWRERERWILRDVADDLATCLMQVFAFEQQRASMLRLEELDLAKTEFISTVSHELRTPLTSITGYVEMITEGALGPVNPAQLQTLGVVDRNAQRLRALVEDLLTLSAFDAKEVRLELEPLDLAEVVAGARASLAPQLASRSLAVSVAAPDGVCWVSGDLRQLERVLANVLSNAVKFTPDGGSVHLDLHPESPETAALVVTDTGIGIPEDEQDRLFTRFFRSTFARAGEVQGTGLGLAVVKTVVEEHDGTIEVSSAEGAGTTVTLRLPRRPAPGGAGLESPAAGP